MNNLDLILSKIRYGVTDYFQFEKLYADELNFLADLMLNKLIEHNIPAHKCNSLFTTAYKGINLIIPLALKLNEKFNTKELKISYCKSNSIEIIGHTPCENDNVILIDDVFRTGHTLLRLYSVYNSMKRCKNLASIVVIHNGSNYVESLYKSKTNIPLLYLKKLDK